MTDELTHGSIGQYSISTIDHPEPGLVVEDGSIQIRGFRSESDDTNYLACSECGEYITIVEGNRAICGCAEIPEAWTTDEL